MRTLTRGARSGRIYLTNWGDSENERGGNRRVHRDRRKNYPSPSRQRIKNMFTSEGEKSKKENNRHGQEAVSSGMKKKKKNQLKEGKQRKTVVSLPPEEGSRNRERKDRNATCAKSARIQGHQRHQPFRRIYRTAPQTKRRPREKRLSGRGASKKDSTSRKSAFKINRTSNAHHQEGTDP